MQFTLARFLEEEDQAFLTTQPGQLTDEIELLSVHLTALAHLASLHYIAWPPNQVEDLFLWNEIFKTTEVIPTKLQVSITGTKGVVVPKGCAVNSFKCSTTERTENEKEM